MKHLQTFTDHRLLTESIMDIYQKKDTIPVVNDIEEAKKLIDEGVYDFKFMDYLIAINMEKLTMGILKLTPKGKYSGYKIKQNYRYNKPERILQVLTDFIASEKSWIKRKEDEKNLKQQKRKEMVNPYKVGDILYSSWGYDQTNVDFYQVTKVGDKSVWVRPIAGEYVPDTQGHDSSNVRPIKDDFRGEEIYKPLVVTTYSEKPHIGGRYPLYPYTSGDKGVYSSWGY
jgi:hypothetical protein